MNETLVQWVLLKDFKYLQSCLSFKLRKKVVEYYSTDFGIIDFALETEKDFLVVELETAINTSAKLDFCVEQVRRYMKIDFNTEKKLKYIILFDKENTPEKFVDLLKDFASKFNVLLRTYSILNIQDLYNKLLEDLRRTTGEYLGQPIAMDVVYLKWLNKVIEPFHIKNLKEMSLEDYKKIYTSRTSFGVYTTLAKDFELIEVKNNLISLTDYGTNFRDNLNPNITSSRSSFNELSVGQKRILLQTLTNGHFTKCKINIYYFLRFIHLTKGEWIPKSSTPENNEKLKFVNFLFGKDYRWKTVIDLLSFTCNQCEELGLIERIKVVNSEYDQAVLASRGSRLLGFLELYLHLKREQIQIPLEISQERND